MMDENVRGLALRVSLDEFVRHFDHLFLLKRPRSRASASRTAPNVEFQTTLVSTRRSGLQLDSTDFADAWMIEAIKKRPGKAFAERTSLGRAPNCDIVIRVPYISKLHALFVTEPGVPIEVFDNRSANGTWVNEVRLDPGERVRLHSGDKLAFGAAEFEVLSAADLHPILRSAPLP